MNQSIKNICVALALILNAFSNAGEPVRFAPPKKDVLLAATSVFALGLGVGSWTAQPGSLKKPSLFDAACIGMGCAGLLYACYSARKHSSRRGTPPPRPLPPAPVNTPGEPEDQPGAPGVDEKREHEKKEIKVWDAWSIPTYMGSTKCDLTTIQVIAMITHALKRVPRAFATPNKAKKDDLRTLTSEERDHLVAYNRLYDLIAAGARQTSMDFATSNAIMSSLNPSTRGCGIDLICKISDWLFTRHNYKLGTPCWLLDICSEKTKCSVCYTDNSTQPARRWRYYTELEKTNARTSNFSTQSQLPSATIFNEHEIGHDFTCSYCNSKNTRICTKYIINGLPPLLFVYATSSIKPSLQIDLSKFCTKKIAPQAHYKLLSIILRREIKSVGKNSNKNNDNNKPYLLFAGNKERTQWYLYDDGKTTMLSFEGEDAQPIQWITRKKDTLDIANLTDALMLYEQVPAT